MMESIGVASILKLLSGISQHFDKRTYIYIRNYRIEIGLSAILCYERMKKQTSRGVRRSLSRMLIKIR